MASELATPASTGAEPALQALVLWLQLVTEAAGALVIAVGLVVTLASFVRAGGNWTSRYAKARLTLARHLALALEFQLAADVLATAVAPNWNQIGQLAAIAVIRTLLNFFLEREMREERAEVERETSRRPAA